MSNSASEHSPVTIIGAGPAGLTAGLELTRRNVRPLILEQMGLVGGLSRTETFQGYRFDLGGHRFYTKIPEIQRLWRDVLPNDFLNVERLSRIYYDGQFYQYPLEVLEIPQKLGLMRGIKVLISWLKYQIRPYPQEDTFEHWISNRFGKYLYEIFFKTYTEKIWGIPCSQIKAEWAAQRIRGLSLPTILWGSLFKNNRIKTLTKIFQYPVLGPGMIWEAFKDSIVSGGGEMHLNCEVVSLTINGNKINSIQFRDQSQTVSVTTDYVISSMALRDLVLRLTPLPPDKVVKAAQSLSYRDFIMVGLCLNHASPFADQWIYIHSPEVKVGRIQNFINWSQSMVPSPQKTSLGMEYFCNQGDAFWRLSDDELIVLASEELERLGLASKSSVEAGYVIRQTRAYPVYTGNYQENINCILSYLKTIKNLQTIGRNGLHRYNNQDHSMLMGILAVQNYFGVAIDLAQVNSDQTYYEELAEEDR